MKIDKLETRLWLAGLAIIVLGAGGLRLAGLSNGLPRYLLGRDETDYFRWTLYLQQYGTLAGSEGEGYPPALLALLIGEQDIVRLVRGSLVQVGDYFLVARLVNVAFACGGVLLGGLIARRVSNSWLAGLLAAGYLAIQVVFVEESRLATAQAPWVAFSLLSLWLLLAARQPLNFPLLFGAFAAGAVSMLFKYQTAPLLVMPLLVILRHGYPDLRRTLPPLAALAAALGALLAWLTFGYHATQIVHTPGSATAAITAESSFELMSFGSSWYQLYQEMGELPYVAVLVTGGVACIWLWRTRSPDLKIDWEGLGWLAVFLAGFYLIMSAFWDVALSKWLPPLNILGIFWAVAVAAIAHLAWQAIRRGFSLALPRRVELSGPPLIALAISLVLTRPIIVRNATIIQDALRPKPSTLAMDWFYANLPQGARIMSEGSQKYLFYVGSGFTRPPQFHAASTASLSSEPLRAYQERGYEYLVAVSDGDGHFSAPLPAEFTSQAQTVLTLTADQYALPKLIVYHIPPLQNHVRYLWFGASDEISFRGFDLPRQTITAGQTLDLTLYWMSVKPTPADEVVFVHVWNEATKTLAGSQDNPPNHGNSPTWSWVGDMQFLTDAYQIPISPAAPPGQYAIRIGMYDASTGSRLPITEIQGAAAGTEVTLANVTIQK